MNENEVSSMKSKNKKTSFVRFKPEVEEIESSYKDAQSKSKTSFGELRAIDAKTKIKVESNLEEDSHAHSNQLHPITIMSFQDTSGGRLVCTALADQCCIGKGPVLHRKRVDRSRFS
jgi:hypothetical protein